MKVLDSHFHVWQLSHVPQPWIDPDEMARINRDFGVAEYEEVLTGCGPPDEHTFEGGVLVQTVHAVQETPRFLELANAHDAVRAVVGWTDISSVQLNTELDRLRELPGGEALVGLRHQLQEEQGDGALNDPRFLEGLKHIESRGLTFDLIVRSDQLGAAARIAAELPELQFVLDHLGKPSIYAQSSNPASFEQWKDAISVLAKCPNVNIKMSGLSTESDWRAWTTSDLRPAFEHAYEHFGSERIMWGSDWPVVEVSGGLGKWTQACRELTATLSKQERGNFWHGTAARVYRIEI